jgi:hypothetical protein
MKEAGMWLISSVVLLSEGGGFGHEEGTKPGSENIEVA